MAQLVPATDPVLRVFYGGSLAAKIGYQTARKTLAEGILPKTNVPGFSATPPDPAFIELEIALMLRENIESRSPCKCAAEHTKSVLTVAGLGEYLAFVRLARRQIDVLGSHGLLSSSQHPVLRPVWLRDQVRIDTNKTVLGPFFSKLGSPARDFIQGEVNGTRFKWPVGLSKIQFF